MAVKSNYEGKRKFPNQLKKGVATNTSPRKEVAKYKNSHKRYQVMVDIVTNDGKCWWLWQWLKGYPPHIGAGK